MKTIIKKEEWKKVELEAVEVDLPEERLFFWHNGIRQAYSVTPVWTKWNKQEYQKEEEIYEYKIVCVDPTDKKIWALSLSVSSFSEILRSDKNPYQRLINNLLFYPNEDRRIEEEFMQDYNRTLEEIAKQLES